MRAAVLVIGTVDRAPAKSVTVNDDPGADVLADVKRGLPLPRESAATIHVQHAIARMSRPECAHFLRECRRVLQPGGRLIVGPLDASRWSTLKRLAGYCGLTESGGGKGPVFEKPARRSITQPPLVSVVITAYKPAFFRAALRSALAQDYPNLEVIVGDDCPTDEIRRIAEAQADPRIRYTRNEPGLGGPANRMACFDRSAGDYIKFLNDDDRLHPRCVPVMAACLAAFPDVTLVTSHRGRIDARGAPLPDDAATARPVIEDCRFDGTSMARLMLDRRLNFVGEPSTVMFRREDLAGAEPHIISFAGRPILPNGDVTMWVNLLGRGDGIYLFDTLSWFRVHEGQMQGARGYRRVAIRAWEELTVLAREMGVVGLPGAGESPPEPLGVKPWWPGDVLERLRRADSAGRRGEWRAVLDELARAIDAVPDDPWLLSTRAGVLLKLGRRSEADEALRRIAAIREARRPAP